MWCQPWTTPGLKPAPRKDLERDGCLASGREFPTRQMRVSSSTSDNRLHVAIITCTFPVVSVNSL